MTSDRPLGRYVVPGIAVLAAIQLVTAGWIVLAPHGFFHAIAAFGPYNGHGLRDAAAFAAGVGIGLAASLAWPALRPGALVAAAATTGLHAVNHWADVSNAHAGSHAGIGDAVTLTLSFAFVVFLILADRGAGAPERSVSAR